MNVTNLNAQLFFLFVCFDYVKLSCSTWQLAPGRSSADCRGALCSDQHVKLHTTGIYPASPRISGNTTDLHRKDDWWYDEVIYIWFLIFLHLNIQNQKYVNVSFLFVCFLDLCSYWWSLAPPSFVASTISMFLMSFLQILAGKTRESLKDFYIIFSEGSKKYF